MTERTFTIAEAHELLPVLRDLLHTAMRAHRRGEEIDEEFQTLISRILISGGIQSDPIHTSRLKSERERCGQRVHDAVEEISAAGVQIKDLEMGLLDFPCILPGGPGHSGGLVLLCWKMGEAAIEHWHSTQEGFAHRKPLDPSMFPSDHPQRLQ